MFRMMILFGFLTVSGVCVADMQSDRMELMQKLVNEGIFQKIEIPGSLPHLWVKPVFYTLDFDTKSSFVSVVYAYYVTENPEFDAVILYDSRTGRKVGAYAAVYGGLKLN